MKTLLLVALSLVALACGGSMQSGDTVDSSDNPMTAATPTAASSSEQGSGPTYPKTRRSDTVDNYHGTEVADPYRWLEDPDSQETKAWVEAQNKVTFGFLAEIPEREMIKTRLTELWNYERYSTPYRMADRYFFRKNDGLQNQSVLYWTESLAAKPKVLLDPNKLSEDGTVALAGSSVSDKGKYLAYGVAKAGSDWNNWRVRDIDTGKDLPETLNWIKFSGATWHPDGSGFYYSRYPAPKEGQALEDSNFNNKVYFHKLNTSQDKDLLVYERPDHKKWGFGTTVTEDGNYLLISVRKGTGPKNLVFYKKLKNGKKRAKAQGTFVEMISNFEASFRFVGNYGPVFYFQTDLDAPRARVIAIDIRKPARKAWREVIQQDEATLRSTSLVGNKLFLNYLRDAKSEIVVTDINGGEKKKLDLPGIGSASGFAGKRKHMETFYSFTGFSQPGSIYQYDIKTGKSTLFRQSKVDFDGSAYETKQVFFKSKDGTKVPMFITHKKGMKYDGSNPTNLYGYGGFNISLTPYFSTSRAAWLEMGGVSVVANLRGGGEYGEEWHQAGTKLNKQNVFDDFIAAAQWLIDNKITSPGKLAISGGSNGGLLVGAAMTQRPELFGAALPSVGVMDMLRFHKFTIGWAWIDDYGSSQDPAEFKALHAYSPYHNLKDGVSYPATMVTTADHDDRVVPAHSFKFAAALQHSHAGPNPVLIRIQTKAGHGRGKPTSMRIAEAADITAFLVKTLNFKPTLKRQGQ